MRLAGAALASLAAALLAWRAGTLTRGGAVAATLVGTAVLAGTGWPGAAALAAFFVSSNLVDRLVAIRHPAPGEAKGSRRDQWQVLANGGPAAVGGLLGVAEPGLGLWVVSASLAAAGADTWATALGATSPHPPRHVLTRTPVPPGTSGGVTLRGTLGGACGGALVAAAGAGTAAVGSLFPTALVIGFLGMLADSVVGATLQGRFRCAGCRVATERRVHRCGRPTEPAGGFAWLTNDGVNAVATALAGLAGGASWWLLGRP